MPGTAGRYGGRGPPGLVGLRRRPAGGCFGGVRSPHSRGMAHRPVPRRGRPRISLIRRRCGRCRAKPSSSPRRRALSEATRCSSAGSPARAWSGSPAARKKTAVVRDRLGADTALDYRSDRFADDLAAACPDGVNLYFDTVGGSIADAVSERLAKRADILLIGRVAANNSAAPEQDMANVRHVWSQEATIHSFNRSPTRSCIRRSSSASVRSCAPEASKCTTISSTGCKKRRRPCTMCFPATISERCWCAIRIATGTVFKDSAADRISCR